MTVNGIELLAKAGVTIDEVEAVCVIVDDRLGRVPPDQIQAWLERIVVFDDWEDPEWNGHSTVPANSTYGFQAWTKDYILRTREYDGKYVLDRIVRNPEGFAHWASGSRTRAMLDIATNLSWVSGRTAGSE